MTYYRITIRPASWWKRLLGVVIGHPDCICCAGTGIEPVSQVPCGDSGGCHVPLSVRPDEETP